MPPPPRRVRGVRVMRRRGRKEGLMRTGVGVTVKEGAQERVWGQEVQTAGSGRPEGLAAVRGGGWQRRGRVAG